MLMSNSGWESKMDAAVMTSPVWAASWRRWRDCFRCSLVTGAMPFVGDEVMGAMMNVLNEVKMYESKSQRNGAIRMITFSLVDLTR